MTITKDIAIAFSAGLRAMIFVLGHSIYFAKQERIEGTGPAFQIEFLVLTQT